MMVRSDHNGQGPAGPMAITLGYQPKSMARHPFQIRVTSELLDCATMASLRMRELLNFNHHQESWVISSSPLSEPRLRMRMCLMSVTLARAWGLLRRTSIPVMTPVVHDRRAYSHPNQRGIPTTSAAMAGTGFPLRHKIKASTKIASRTMQPYDSQAWSMAQTSPQMRLETVAARLSSHRHCCHCFLLCLHFNSLSIAFCCRCVRALDQVSVDIKRDRRLGMTESAANGEDIHTFRDQR